MSTQLLHFVFNTLYPRLNNPKNKNFLPTQLEGIDNPNGGGKLLPLQGESWNLGEIKGSEGTTISDSIATAWWATFARNPEAKGRIGIPCPSSPWPQFAIPQATVKGLDNVRVLPDFTVTATAQGYQLKLLLEFGYYQGQDGNPKLDAVQILGHYDMKQSVCSAQEATPHVCDGWKEEEIEGLGQFTATIQNMHVEATLTLQAVQGSQRNVELVVDQLVMRGAGSDPYPSFTIDSLTVDNSASWAKQVWIAKAKEALTSADGQKALMENLSALLQAPDNRNSISNTLTQQCRKLFDDALGQVGGSLPHVTQSQVSNEFDQYLYDRVRAALNAPNSDFYLPKAVYRISDPTLEPYAFQNLELGKQSMGDLEFDSVTLTTGSVRGLSNLKLAPEQLLFDGADAHINNLAVSALNPPPSVEVNGTSHQVPSPPLTIEGQFSMKADGFDEPLTGSYTVTISRSTLQTVLHFAGESLEDLTLTFTSLSFQASTADVQLQVHIDSEFEDLINQIFNQDSIKSTLVKGINDQAQKSLGDISRFATHDVKQFLTDKLDS